MAFVEVPDHLFQEPREHLVASVIFRIRIPACDAAPLEGAGGRYPQQKLVSPLPVERIRPPLLDKPIHIHHVNTPVAIAVFGDLNPIEKDAVVSGAVNTGQEAFDTGVDDQTILFAL